VIGLEEGREEGDEIVGAGGETMEEGDP